MTDNRVEAKKYTELKYIKYLNLNVWSHLPVSPLNGIRPQDRLWSPWAHSFLQEDMQYSQTEQESSDLSPGFFWDFLPEEHT